ncbi:hypothetical protein SAMN05660649_04346 [Desulfotomaculum arcticum]|uniref:Uncharacterized protein n=1 Tax=Desulfotruncus arcticus DSM 17038 TaxID=1121424 RepID=A0A1I2YBA8_9FIRM|nr:hypothetical protein [Desulfotruncus arcticus]SFH22647.1 hypothetical protein SAMN05660649_04346 [Desulfotomaculum arcticum] [Desulfotruncus arcticus DSM 17038]
MGLAEADLADKLATRYAATRDTDTFDELYHVMYSIVRRDAKRHYINTRIYGIAYEDLESIFLQCLYEEALIHKGGGLFIRNYRAKCNRELIKEINRKKAQRRYKEGLPPIYTSGLDRLENLRLSGKFIRKSLEDEIIDRLDAKKLLADFVAKAHKQYSKIILLLIDGYTNEEIAAVLGSNRYSPKIRKTVSRAKKTYRLHCEAELLKAS